MGFFSWKTADTDETIWNIHSNQDANTVYLLQPDGEAPIREDAYDGYGMFGGTDAYVWLARRNLPADEIAGRTDEDLRMAGITLFYDRGEPGANPVRWPLKFSFDPAADYAKLGASPACDTQGFLGRDGEDVGDVLEDDEDEDEDA